MPATTISVEGDRAFVLRLKKLAALREQTVAELVRNALESAYGDDLRRVPDASFFAQTDASTHHISNKA